MKTIQNLMLLTFAALFFAAAVSVQAEQPSKADAAAFDVFRNLVKEQPGKNIVYSPFSLRQAMQLAYVGADKKTAKEMDSLFGYADNKPAAETPKANDQEESENGFFTANSVWILPNYAVKDSYKETVQKLGAEVNNLDSADTVNQWVNNKTHGKIPKVLDAIGENTKAVLTNAVYFNGKWQKPFDKRLIARRQFNNADGSRSRVLMMRQNRCDVSGGQKDYYAYASLGYRQLPFSMTIILPNKGVKFADFLRKFDAAEWQSLFPSEAEDYEKHIKAFRKIVKLEMLKFETEMDFNLIPALKASGVDEAFDENKADFSKMTADPKGLYIAGVKQKVFFDMNEEGTKAAAVTPVEIAEPIASETPPKTMDFIVDRPFLYILSGNVDGKEHILFMGSYVKAPK